MSRRIRSKAVNSGMNFEGATYRDDRWVRCWNCNHPVNLDRSAPQPVGAESGDGISQTSVVPMNKLGADGGTAVSTWDTGGSVVSTLNPRGTFFQAKDNFDINHIYIYMYQIYPTDSSSIRAYIYNYDESTGLPTIVVGSYHLAPTALTNSMSNSNAWDYDDGGAGNPGSAGVGYAGRVDVPTEGNYVNAATPKYHWARADLDAPLRVTVGQWVGLAFNASTATYVPMTRTLTGAKGFNRYSVGPTTEWQTDDDVEYCCFASDVEVRLSEAYPATDTNALHRGPRDGVRTMDPVVGSGCPFCGCLHYDQRR